MSKKMMKRSLALGALMAFVITGSAMAASGSLSGEIQSGVISGNGTLDAVVGPGNTPALQTGISSGTLAETVTINGYSAMVLNGSNNVHSNAFNAYKNTTLNIITGDVSTSENADLINTTVFHAQGGKLDITAGDISLDNVANGFMSQNGGQLIVDANDIVVNANNGNALQCSYYQEDSSITINADNLTLVSKTAAGISSMGGDVVADVAENIYIEGSNGVNANYGGSVTLEAQKITVTNNGSYNAVRAANGGSVSINGTDSVIVNGRVYAEGNNSEISIDGGNVDIISGEEGVAALKGGNAIVTGNNIKIDVDSADNFDGYVYGVHAGERSVGNGSVTIGDENTKSVIIDVNGKDANGIFARAYNNSGKEEDQSSVIVKGAKLDITVDGTGDGIAGIWAASGTESKNAPSSIVTLETADTKISATNGVGIVSYSNGTVDVKGNLDIDANCAIQTRGYAKTFINATKDKTVTIDGDIAFTKEYDQANVITDAEVVLNLSNGNSYLEGNIYVDNFDSVVNNKATYKDITGMALGISNGAYWATQAGDGAVDNFVNDLTMSNGTIKHNNEGNITVNNYSGNGIVELNTEGHLHIDEGAGSLNLTMAEKTADDYNDAAGLTEVAKRLGVSQKVAETDAISAKVVMAEGDIKGETTGVVTFVAPAEDVNKEEVPADNAKVAPTED